jgi:hypothetical protein
MSRVLQDGGGSRSEKPGNPAIRNEGRREMSGTPTLYCLTCGAFRAVEDWHERGDALVIELEPCGHVLHRHAGVEWPIRTAA